MTNKANLKTDAVLAGLKFWVWVSIAMALCAESLHTLLYGRPAFLNLSPDADVLRWCNFIGSLAGMPACILYLAGVSPLPRKLWSQLLLVLGLPVYAAIFSINGTSGIESPVTVFTILLLPIGVSAILLVLYAAVFPTSHVNRGWLSLYKHLAILMGALGIACNAGLTNTEILFPATWDYHVYRIDAAFGGFAAELARINETGGPLLKTFTTTVYSLLIPAQYAVLGIAIRKGEVTKLGVWRTLVMPYMVVFFIYAFIPVSGPVYAFFDGRFPFNLPQAADVPSALVVIPPAYRNGIPSMHLTGALLVWMMSLGVRERISILFTSLLVLATLWSTLATGEHYVLDLIIAFPYAAFIGVALIWPRRLFDDRRAAFPVWVSGATALVWFGLLRFLADWLSNNLFFVQCLSVWSVLCAAVVYGQLVVSLQSQETVRHESLRNQSVTSKVSASPKWVVALFAASGLAGLVYEVVYAKALAITFGSTALASYTVLATYMGGMALGAWFGGRLADNAKSPLRAYAVCETLIGAYACLTPKLFTSIQQIYVYLSLDAQPDAVWVTALRIALGAACLGVPTLLMGMTMPIMFRHLRDLGVASTEAISRLYGANVAGAALGSVLAGYFILPVLGRNGATYVAALVSLLAALYAIERSKQSTHVSALPAPCHEPITRHIETKLSNVIGFTAFAVLLIGGAITLGLEVSFMHLLAVVAGNSVYAFGLMLSTFLCGLGLGSVAGERAMEKCSRISLVAWSQCGIALAIAFTAHSWDDIPSYFASFGIYPARLGFAARETIRAIVCASAMMPSAFFIGLCYPAAMSLASDWRSPAGKARGLGLASGINTLGNILGVILVGGWLLPVYGSRSSLLVLSLIALGLGLLALLASHERKENGISFSFDRYWRWAPVFVAASMLLGFPRQWSYGDLATGSNVYFAGQNWGDVIDQAESVEGGLTLVTKDSKGTRTLLTNGKFQGNDSKDGEMLAQESFALFPLLHTSLRDNALVIGYGTGMTTRVLNDADFKRVDVAELSKDIVAMSNKHFKAINHGVSNRPGVSVYYTDGRNYLLTQSRRYDLVSIEITSIWFAGAANLYNKEFYSLAKQRLTANGILQQWVQLHHTTALDLLYLIGSVRSEFNYVWLYVRGGQGIIVASNSVDALNQPGAAQVAAGMGKENAEHSPDKLRKHLVLSPAGIDKFISSFDPSMSLLVSTDNNLFLEYSTPKGNALGDVVRQNIQLLSSYEPQAVAYSK